MLRHAAVYLGPHLGDGADRPIALGPASALLDEDPRSTFDLVLLIEVAQHIPEPELANLLPRLAAALAPGGRLFVCGNQLLDVDSRGRLTTTAVRDVVADHLRVLREDAWEIEPQTRFSLVCARADE
jgi:hypothetical protein